MQIYLGYRHHDFDFDTVDSAGTRTSGERLHSFQTIVVGSKLAF